MPRNAADGVTRSHVPAMKIALASSTKTHRRQILALGCAPPCGGLANRFGSTSTRSRREGSSTLGPEIQDTGDHPSLVVFIKIVI